MDSQNSNYLVILAGGQSRRMGQDKAVITLDGKRLIDRAAALLGKLTGSILISGDSDFGTDLPVIRDDPNAPDGPVGAIFTIASRLSETISTAAGFTTIPVDAPFLPHQLIGQLSDNETCAVARGPERLHPTIAHWRSMTVNHVQQQNLDLTKAPSLHWLARQCDAGTTDWPDEAAFANINTATDLEMAEKRIDNANT